MIIFYYYSTYKSNIICFTITTNNFWEFTLEQFSEDEFSCKNIIVLTRKAIQLSVPMAEIFSIILKVAL